MAKIFIDEAAELEDIKIGISVFDWKKYLPSNAEIVGSDYSGLYFIKEQFGGNTHYSTLDRIAAIVKHFKGKVNAFHRNLRLNKKSAERIANDLYRQADKLENLAQTYRILATALNHSLDDIEEVVRMDETIKKALDNPF